MVYKIPKQRVFFEMLSNFRSYSHVDIAMFYYRNKDEFYSIAQVSYITGYSPNKVRAVKEYLTNKKGVCFANIGTSVNRASKMIGIVDGKGHTISEADYIKKTTGNHNMNINKKGRANKEYNFDLHQNKTQILVNSIFK